MANLSICIGLPASQAAIYTATGLVYLKFMRTANKDTGAPQTHSVLIKVGGVEVPLIPLDQSIPAKGVFPILEESFIALNNGDTIQAVASGSSKVFALMTFIT